MTRLGLQSGVEKTLKANGTYEVKYISQENNLVVSSNSDRNL